MSEIRLYRGTWCLYARHDGRPVRRSLGTKDRAVALSRMASVQLVEKNTRSNAGTVEFYWTSYRTHLADRPAATTMGYEGRSLLPVLGHLPAASLTPNVVRSYMKARADRGIKPGTLLTEMNRLAAALNWAVKNGLLASAPHIPRPPAPPPRLRFLTSAEADALVAASETPHARLFVILGLTTAARSTAILSLRWGDVDFDAGLIHFGNTLDGRRRKRRISLPMNDSARMALEEAQGRALTPFVIEYGAKPVACIKTAVRGAARRAGLTDVSPHVLRHSAAVRMAESGVPMTAISQFLGHTDSRVTERVYARYSPTYLRVQAAALDLKGVLSGAG